MFLDDLVSANSLYGAGLGGGEVDYFVSENEEKRR